MSARYIVMWHSCCTAYIASLERRFKMWLNGGKIWGDVGDVISSKIHVNAKNFILKITPPRFGVGFLCKVGPINSAQCDSQPQLSRLTDNQTNHCQSNTQIYPILPLDLPVTHTLVIHMLHRAPGIQTKPAKRNLSEDQSEGQTSGYYLFITFDLAVGS